MPFNKPRDAICRVLRKIGVDPNMRITAFCQDPEYTSCRHDEIEAYLELYRHGSIDHEEREVLCCFMLQGLNDLCAEGTPHPLQAQVFEAIFNAQESHAEELKYWMNINSDHDPDNWWPITTYLLEYRNCAHHKREGHSESAQS